MIYNPIVEDDMRVLNKQEKLRFELSLHLPLMNLLMDQICQYLVQTSSRKKSMDSSSSHEQVRQLSRLSNESVKNVPQICCGGEL